MTCIPLFIAEPTGTCRLSLRRFRYTGDGETHGHDAAVVIDENAPATPPGPDGRHPATDSRIPHGDPRWPAACGCGEPFRDDDHWQINEAEWHEGGGQRFAWGIGSWDGPPGAVIRASWRDIPGRPDAWVVFLPNGTTWCTNDRAARAGGSQLGPYWTVTGPAPALTVAPSIADRSSRPWHGWVRNGELVTA